MAIMDLIADLESASEGRRELDSSIGLTLGWLRKVEHKQVAGSSEATRNVVWIAPISNKPSSSLPHFSTSLDAAFFLVSTVIPGGRGAVSWEPGGSSFAAVNSGEYCSGATPAVALCIAVLKSTLAREDEI